MALSWGLLGDGCKQRRCWATLGPLPGIHADLALSKVMEASCKQHVSISSPCMKWEMDLLLAGLRVRATVAKGDDRKLVWSVGGQVAYGTRCRFRVQENDPAGSGKEGANYAGLRAILIYDFPAQEKASAATGVAKSCCFLAPGAGLVARLVKPHLWRVATQGLHSLEASAVAPIDPMVPYRMRP